MDFLCLKILKRKKSGFTLIELLVVIAIIGILSTVVISSLNSTRGRGKDTNRLSDVKQIEKALDLYYMDYGYYPKRRAAHTEVAVDSCGGTLSWCGSSNSLKSDLSPYYKLPSKNSDGFNKSYYYSSLPGNNYQTYGLMVDLEGGSNSSKESGDGGWYSTLYETGFNPKYCKDKYNKDWWIASSYVCPDGN